MKDAKKLKIINDGYRVTKNIDECCINFFSIICDEITRIFNSLDIIRYDFKYVQPEIDLFLVKGIKIQSIYLNNGIRLEYNTSNGAHGITDVHNLSLDQLLEIWYVFLDENRGIYE